MNRSLIRALVTVGLNNYKSPCRSLTGLVQVSFSLRKMTSPWSFKELNERFGRKERNEARRDHAKTHSNPALRFTGCAFCHLHGDVYDIPCDVYFSLDTIFWTKLLMNKYTKNQRERELFASSTAQTSWRIIQSNTIVNHQHNASHYKFDHLFVKVPDLNMDQSLLAYFSSGCSNNIWREILFKPWYKYFDDLKSAEEIIFPHFKNPKIERMESKWIHIGPTCFFQSSTKRI